MRRQLKSLARSTAVYGLGGALTRSLQLLFLPLFTAYMTPADYGVVTLLGLVSFVVVPVFSLGFGAALAPAYYDRDDQAHQSATVWTAFTILLVAVSLMLAIGILFSREIAYRIFQSASYQTLLVLALASAGLSILADPWGLCLRFQCRARTFVSIAIASSVISIASTVALVVFLRKGAFGMVLAGLLGQTVTLLLNLIAVAPRLELRVGWNSARRLLSLGIPLVPSFVFLFVIQHGNKYFLQEAHGLATVGVYSVGFNLGLALGLVVSAFQNAWLPYFMAFLHRRVEARRLFGRILVYYLVGVGSVNLLFFIFAKPVVMLVAQPGFHDAYRIVGFSAATQLLSGLASILMPGIYFAGELPCLAITQLGAAALAIGLDFALIPRYGLNGAGAALFLGTLSMPLLLLVWNRARRYDFIDLAGDGLRLAAFCGLFALIAALSLAPRSWSLPRELTFSLGLTIVLAGCLYGLLNSSERREFKASATATRIGLPTGAARGTP